MGIRNTLKKKLVRVEKNPVYIPLIAGEFLKGKTILISGGSGGIGYAISEACLRNGGNVILAGRNTAKLEAAKNQLLEKVNNGKVATIAMDISDARSIHQSIISASEKSDTGTIEILINNAGVQAGRMIGETAESDYDMVLDTNLKGTYFMCQEFSNYLIKNNIQGNILNISSVSGIRPAVSPYMLSKWGITGLTKGLAKKLIPYDIVVNGIAPGPTATDMLIKNDSDLMYEKAPAGRFASPVEIANLAVFMISDMGRMIVGETVVLSGGCGNLTVDDIKYN